MRIFLKRLFIFLILLSWPFALAQAATEQTAANAAIPASPSTVSSSSIVSLNECTDSKLKVHFSCNPDWELQTEHNTMLIIIFQKPLVTMTVGKSDTHVLFVEQLTKDNLQEMGQYAEGFTIEKGTLAGENAVRVSGFPKDHPEVKFLDYYILHDLHLYSVLFSVSPKERWNDYGALFNKILQSFAFSET